MKCKYCGRETHKDTMHVYHIQDPETFEMIWICEICYGKIDVKIKEGKTDAIKAKVK